MVQTEEKVREPAEVAAFDFWVGKIPCWQMCHCPEVIKRDCPAPKYPSSPCWEIEGTYCKLTDDGINGRDLSICRSCRVYKRWGENKPIELKLFGKGIDSFRRALGEKAETAFPELAALHSDTKALSRTTEGAKAEGFSKIEKRRHPMEVRKPEMVEQIIARYDGDKGVLIEVMLDAQQEYGWLPKEALRAISEKLGVPITRLYRIATYYDQTFSLIPRGRYMVEVCMDTACKERGAAQVLENLEKTLGIKVGETTPDGKFTLVTVTCTSRCSGAPVAKLDGQWHYGELPEVEIRRVSSSLK